MISGRAVQITRKYVSATGRLPFLCPVQIFNVIYNMKKIILKYGLISGALSAALMLATGVYYHYNPGKFENSELVGYTGILLSMLVVFFGVRAYRDQEGEGKLSFGKGFQIGLIIVLISSTIYVLTWQIVSHTLLSDFMDQYMQYTIEKMKQSGMSAEGLAQKTAEMEHYKELFKNPFISTAIIFIEPLPMGLLVTLVSAVALRKN